MAFQVVVAVLEGQVLEQVAADHSRLAAMAVAAANPVDKPGRRNRYFDTVLARIPPDFHPGKVVPDLLRP